jgi:ribonuclease HI
VGIGSNNLSELMALHLTLLLVLEKGVTNIQFFGESLLVIKWVKEEYALRNYILQPVLDEIIRLIQAFDHISFIRVYRERNQVADALSKEGFLLARGIWIIQERADGLVNEYLHPSVV